MLQGNNLYEVGCSIWIFFQIPAKYFGGVSQGIRSFFDFSLNLFIFGFIGNVLQLTPLEESDSTKDLVSNIPAESDSHILFAISFVLQLSY